MQPIAQILANELNVQLTQVDAAVALLDEGSTVPFISRYRKEVTGGLDDIQLRQLNDRLGYLRELAERRLSVLSSIDEQGKLTPDLIAAIEQADTKTRLEDLYLPYKKKRRTKGQIAIEAGLEPLANAIMADFNVDPEMIDIEYFIVRRKLPEDSMYPIKRIQSFVPASGKPTRNKLTRSLNEFVTNSFTPAGLYNMNAKHIAIAGKNNKHCTYCEFKKQPDLCPSKERLK